MRWCVSALGAATAGRLVVLEHETERGYRTPVHRHDAADETFFVLDSELRVDVGGESYAAGAGAVAFLPRGLPHALVVTSPHARYLSLHQPAGFDEFTQAAGTVATSTTPPDQPPLDPAALAAIARRYRIEILGPPPAL